eukprot:jgi/Chrzof1/10013/Cz04g24040.t1
MEPIQNALSSALAHVTGRGSLTTEPSVGASANLENAASLLREALAHHDVTSTDLDTDTPVSVTLDTPVSKRDLPKAPLSAETIHSAHDDSVSLKPSCIPCCPAAHYNAPAGSDADTNPSQHAAVAAVTHAKQQMSDADDDVSHRHQTADPLVSADAPLLGADASLVEDLARLRSAHITGVTTGQQADEGDDGNAAEAIDADVTGTPATAAMQGDHGSNTVDMRRPGDAARSRPSPAVATAVGPDGRDTAMMLGADDNDDISVEVVVAEIADMEAAEGAPSDLPGDEVVNTPLTGTTAVAAAEYAADIIARDGPDPVDGDADDIVEQLISQRTEGVEQLPTLNEQAASADEPAGRVKGGQRGDEFVAQEGVDGAGGEQQCGEGAQAVARAAAMAAGLLHAGTSIPRAARVGAVAVHPAAAVDADSAIDELGTGAGTDAASDDHNSRFVSLNKDSLQQSVTGAGASSAGSAAAGQGKRHGDVSDEVADVIRHGGDVGSSADDVGLHIAHHDAAEVAAVAGALAHKGQPVQDAARLAETAVLSADVVDADSSITQVHVNQGPFDRFVKVDTPVSVGAADRLAEAKAKMVDA